MQSLDVVLFSWQLTYHTSHTITNCQTERSSHSTTLCSNPRVTVNRTVPDQFNSKTESRTRVSLAPSGLCDYELSLTAYPIWVRCAVFVTHKNKNQPPHHRMSSMQFAATFGPGSNQYIYPWSERMLRIDRPTMRPLEERRPRAFSIKHHCLHRIGTWS